MLSPRVEELRPILDHVAEFGADHLNLQADVRPHTVAECVPLIEGWRQLARDAGVALHLETHRDRMTTDLYFTLRLLDRFPDLRLTGDLSHYVVGREFAWPISAENHRLMHRVIDQCWGFHGRVASREQIQVQISFAHQRDWLDLFMGWWEYGFRSWRRRAPADATLTFLCELGPREYAMTGSDGYELSDRWQEAQLLMRMVRELWARLEREDQVLDRARRLVQDHRLAADLGLHRVGDEAGIVRLMVQALDLGPVRQLLARELDRRMEDHHGHRQLADLVLSHHAGRRVGVAVDAPAGARGDVQEPQHVAARQRRDEGLFRIDRGGVGVRQRHDMRRRRARHLDAAIEAQPVAAAVAAADEVLGAGVATPPDGLGGVVHRVRLRRRGPGA